MSLQFNKRIDSKLVDQIRNHYKENIEVDTDEYSIITSPFKILRIKQFLETNGFIDSLLKAINKTKFIRKNNDLYSLWQTADLKNFSDPAIKNVVSFLQDKFDTVLGYITNNKFNAKFSITASLYAGGDFLLCHDDKCEDRVLAFVFYLTGKLDAGGAFEMFSRDDKFQPKNVAVTIDPVANSFICFEVGNTTYHQVSEVTDNKFLRLSINGWYHGNRPIPRSLVYREPSPLLHRQTKIEGMLLLEDFCPTNYCLPSSMDGARSVFQREGFLMLKQFFHDRYYDGFLEEISKDVIKWTQKGPANRRNYEVADIHNLPPSVDFIVKLLTSSLFVSTLKRYTGLKLQPYSGVANTKSTPITIEVIRWTTGCYSMITDHDEFLQKPGLDLYLFFDCDEVINDVDDTRNTSGFIHYLNPEKPTNENKVVTLIPADNALTLCHRKKGTVRFTRYLNNKISKRYYAIYATYYEIKQS